MTSESERVATRPRFGQETIAIIATIVTVGIAIAGLVLATVNDLREEARADRAAWQAESRQLRDEARADREASRADREAFQREMLRLTEAHARLAAVVSSTRAEE